MSNAEKIEEAKELWKLCASPAEQGAPNTVPGDQYAEILRAVGLKPNPNEESRSPQQLVNENEFINRVQQSTQTGQHQAHEELASAFKIFDTKNSGLIAANDLRNILTNLGDKMDNAEVEVIIQKLRDMSNGQKTSEGDDAIDINTFTEVMLHDGS